jgi:periplasmic divalent cation tolerance protein
MFVSIYITVGMEKEAKNIAKTLLKKKLIACANLFPVMSLFYWEDRLQEDDEIALIMKTRNELVDKVIDEIKKLHSYEIPCIVVWQISKGNEDYLSWIEKETQLK